MKKMITIPLTIIMLFAFGAALYFTEQNVTKAYADPPACTTCSPSCHKVDNQCYLRGSFCLDATNIDDAVFWYKIGGSGGWSSAQLSQTVVCHEGCVGYVIDPEIPVTCGEVTFGWDVTKNIQCGSGYGSSQIVCP